VPFKDGDYYYEAALRRSDGGTHLEVFSMRHGFLLHENENLFGQLS
jgi:hypothetical protein